MTYFPLDTLVARVADRPVAMLNLARTLLAMGHVNQARELAERALAAGADSQTHTLAAEILSFGVPVWHFTIVRDEVRNAAYDAALRRTVRPGMRVLEIGTGSGLLAMMAARAGAGHVCTCEMNPSVAAAARQVIARNGYSDRITVIGKHSADIDAAQDMGGLADLMVSEIVSNDMLAEAALPAHEQAIRRLLQPGARIIPARGTVRAALGFDSKFHYKRMGEIAGFDLSPFNSLAQQRYQIPVGDKRVSLNSEPVDLVTFDFEGGGPYPEQTSRATLTVDADGANGIVQWIQLDMDGEGVYENDPRTAKSSCWALQFYPFPTSMQLVKGQQVTLVCSHDRQTLRIWVEA